MLADQFKIVKKIGEGATADVYLVENIKTNENYACKVLKTGPNDEITDKAREDFINEANIVTGIKHPNIVNIIFVGCGALQLDGQKAKTVLFIVMEYVEHGEFFDILNYTGAFSEETARYFFLQI